MWTAAYACMRGGSYFRFYWQQPIPGGKAITRHLHIRGGNSTNLLATLNRAQVDAAIAAGKSLEEIKSLVLSFGRQTGNFKREIREP